MRGCEQTVQADQRTLPFRAAHVERKQIPLSVSPSSSSLSLFHLVKLLREEEVAPAIAIASHRTW